MLGAFAVEHLSFEVISLVIGRCALARKSAKRQAQMYAATPAYLPRFRLSTTKTII
jgi:hypothetical protein